MGRIVRHDAIGHNRARIEPSGRHGMGLLPSPAFPFCRAFLGLGSTHIPHSAEFGHGALLSLSAASDPVRNAFTPSSAVCGGIVCPLPKFTFLGSRMHKGKKKGQIP